MNTLKDKTILVTGSSQGIGKATILFAAEKGAKVAINYLNDQSEAEEVKTQALAKGALEAVIIQADVSDYRSCQNLIEKTISSLGSLDVLVNNAGVLSMKNLEEESIEKLQAVIKVNLIGQINMIHAALPHLQEQSESTIINITSIAGLEPYPGVATYCASKYGVVGLTQALAKELEPHNISIYAVAPGAVDTPMIEGMGFDGMPPKNVAQRILDLATGKLELESGGISEIRN